MALTANAGELGGDIISEMKAVRDKHNVDFGRQVLDYLDVRAAGMSFEEYILYGLYNRNKAERAAYFGNDRARAAFYIANKMTSWDAAEDKLFFSTLVADAGAPTPKILGLVHATRQTGDAVKMRNLDDVVRFLKTCPLPVFGKPVIAAHGDGSIHVTGRDGDFIVDGRGARRSIEEVAGEILETSGASGYLFQEALSPSAQMAEITAGKLATARFLVLVGKDGARLRHAVLRIPANGNDVDSFQRPGNLIAPIDVETGRLGPAKCGVGPRQTTMSEHPDTSAAIDGVTLELFHNARDIVLKASGIYPDLHLQSWDVAFSDKGPMLVEMNPGGHFMLLQMAAGRGVFDEDFRTFLQECMATGRIGNPNPKAMKEAKKLLKLA